MFRFSVALALSLVVGPLAAQDKKPAKKPPAIYYHERRLIALEERMVRLEAVANAALAAQERVSVYLERVNAVINAAGPALPRAAALATRADVKN